MTLKLFGFPAVALVMALSACSPDASAPPSADAPAPEAVEPDRLAQVRAALEGLRPAERPYGLSNEQYTFTDYGPDPRTLGPVPDISTGTEFAEAFPEKAERLLGILNLDHPGLDDVAAAAASGDTSGAMEALAAYYRTTDNGAWLKGRTGVHDPGGYNDFTPLAEEVLADIYTFQSVKAEARRLENGRIDWLDRGPKGDFQWEIFLNRHFHFLPLLKAYEVTGDPALAAYIDTAILDFVTSNPVPPDAESDRQFSGVWRPMSTATRLLQSWPQVFYFLQDEPAFSDAARLMMLSAAYDQAVHTKEYHRRKHNHAIKEMIGLSHAAAAWPEFKEAAEWRDYALGVLVEELDYQIYPDGVQKELSSHYHRTVLDYFMQYVSFMRSAGYPAPPEFEARIETMGEFQTWAMRPDGAIPLNNNADRDQVRPIVMQLADLFDHEDWRYIATHGAEGVAPDTGPSRFWPWSGQLFARSGWSADADWSIFEFGPWGISHQHNDILQFAMASGGRDLIVDTGRYIYKDVPMTNYVRSTRGANLILVDGKQQNPAELEFTEPMDASHAVITETYTVGFGTFDAGFEGLDGDAVHHRSVAYLNELGWVIVDWLETDRPRQLTSHWHFHPEVGAALEGEVVTSADPDVSNVRLQPVGLNGTSAELVKGQEEPFRGWYSPFYNVQIAAPLAVYETPVEGNAIFAWLITTERDGAPEAVDVTLMDQDPEAGRITLDVADFGTVRFDLPARSFSLSE